MPIHEIRCAGSSERESWDGYVSRQPEASLFHLFGWQEVIHGTYGHKTYYLMAVRREAQAAVRENSSLLAENAVGILPLVHLKHVIFGNCLVSLPFLDGGSDVLWLGA